ncbi:MerR family transcriptional regulator [Lactonifactor sp. BIOML-A3]|uniref:MerR family transcriptional regulator n=1 Tax=unclassified Lactonifactor TaxID=2636670 RepID=UPI0012AF253C|nr:MULTISPECIES: MerR family transcriptional regulator [unclassified Lactonifactor]MSA04048.1 MerR family transcriptional regulator [Lactonifactor sp. BIOML-A5]MSA10652.1 MerR family transcriptional regulator [Lactonifactor sp. BIOML-A4]MSA15149.1 MerR family transcriptional regulator [Lactonifactor sp. BIOML-A3]MSA19589.1 MerR family transcriptional regulator [Lactonifactor sp. BIOML-A2]MSA40216.1 MerR family transcriptional regulator [Lactonifactor sp. BIOML-A1]
MKTVKEVSNLTGISVRTLHYYDEIDLLKPTVLSEAGYRFYDDKALEKLQQILFLRELDLPLKQIKEILENPDLDKKQLLYSQKRMLVVKKERLERIIASIGEILKGDNKMNFEVFSKADLEDMYRNMETNMTKEQQEIFKKEYGSMEQFKEQFLESASSRQAQKNFAKVVEWYGDKESALKASANPENSKILDAYGNRLEQITRKLADKTGQDVNTFEVKEIVGEMDFVCRQLYQMDDVTALMLDMAEKYITNKKMQENLDAVYGDGSTLFIGQALKAFYIQPEE